MEKSNNDKELTKSQIDEIIKVIEYGLIDNGKSYATLAYANSLLKKKGVFTMQDQYNQTLKKLLEEGYIKHAYQTESKPRQWRIPLTPKGKIKLEETIKINSNIIENPNKSWYNSLDNETKKRVWKRVIIGAIVIFILFDYIRFQINDNSNSNSFTKEINTKSQSNNTYKKIEAPFDYNSPSKNSNNRIKESINKYVEINKNNEIIGKWFQDENVLIFFVKKNGKYFLNEMQIDNNQIGKDWELIHKRINNKPAFIIKDFLEGNNLSPGVKVVNDYTDYYLLGPDGNLALYDKDGLIEKYQIIN